MLESGWAENVEDKPVEQVLIEDDVEDKPNMSWTKKELQSECDNQNISYKETDSKSKLVEKLNG